MVLWVWYNGDREMFPKYDVTIELKTIEDQVLLRAQIPLFSLNLTYSKDILDYKKGSLISSATLEKMGFYSGKSIFDVKITNNTN